MFFIVLLFSFLVGCSNKDVTLPEDIPEFVEENDFKSIDWEKKAIKFGEQGIIGNENKSGVIGAEMPSLNNQKWMWHLWGDNLVNKNLTVVGFHKKSETISPVLTTGWFLPLR